MGGPGTRDARRGPRPLPGAGGRAGGGLGVSTFPLSAIVGQEPLVEALLVCAVDPGVGGVLVRGERGTAKSTAVRALSDLLADGGRLVEVPLGTTLDRLVGALDLGRALAGEAAYEEGLLVRADGGMLYVDEVNLLADHLVDALLDAAATGVVRVEREAVSVTRESRFLLVGTMNAEEGELRPQLLDRFALGVDVTTPRDPAVRAEVVRRRLAFEADRAGFVAAWASAEAALRARIAAARAVLARVVLPERELLRITGACAALGLDGVRGDVVCARTARVLAALDGVEVVDAGHVERAAQLALAHRRRRDPLERADAGQAEIADAVAGAAPDGDPPHEPPPDGPEGPDGPGGGGGSRPPAGDDGPARGGDRSHDGPWTPPSRSQDAPARAQGGAAPDPSRAQDDPSARPGGEQPDPSARAAAAGGVPDPERAALRARLALAGRGEGPAGRRGRSVGPDAGVIDTRAAEPGDPLALVPTLLARLPYEPPHPARETHGGRTAVRAGREGALLVLVVDTSGSMAAQRRLARVKGALLDTLRDAYARRDRVAILAFRDAAATLVAAPGTPLEQAAAAVRALPAGGRTPLAAGLDAAADVVHRERVRDPRRRALVVVLTDGRAPQDQAAATHAAGRRLAQLADVHLVDTEDGPVRLGLAAELARAADATVTTLSTRRAA
ncbi:VWA domain-containing protein [Conexibacter sp. W3-3-2]|nr:VWA domain-containing protein [Conexibacter sp. W3-3-2]